MFTDRRANTLPTRRVRQPWPAGKPFKILSMDGGGIRGVYTAELIRLCEETFGRGEPLARYFDMIAGTSTGGIIALGLGLGIPTADITAFYRDDGRRIFPPLPRRWPGKARQLWAWLRAPKLMHEELEAALKHRFREHLLGESSTRLVIPAFMMPKTEIAVFKTDHHKDFRNDHLTPMWKVARSTSAAPTYLKGLEHEESGRIFIDGDLGEQPGDGRGGRRLVRLRPYLRSDRGLQHRYRQRAVRAAQARYIPGAGGVAGGHQGGDVSDHRQRDGAG